MLLLRSRLDPQRKHNLVIKIWVNITEVNEKFDQMARNLTEKENAMGTLLNQINRSSSKLVQIGLLPSVPGLFTVGLSSNPHEHLDNTAKESLNDNQHAKSLPAHLVSSNLQSLVQNMELFKTYLIQVESCKMKLIQLQQDIEVITNGGDRSGLNIEQVDHRRVKTEVVESSSQTTKGEIESIVVSSRSLCFCYSCSLVDWLPLSTRQCRCERVVEVALRCKAEPAFK